MPKRRWERVDDAWRTTERGVSLLAMPSPALPGRWLGHAVTDRAHWTVGGKTKAQVKASLIHFAGRIPGHR